jgi:ankyrin repeat protein
MVAVVADKIDVIDLLLKHNVDIEVCDINGESAIDIAKKFNNKLGQHRLVQFKWRKRTEEEMRKKLEALKKNNGLIPIIDDRLPHQIYDSQQKTWFKGDYIQMYMAQIVEPNEFSGTGFSAPKTLKIREKLAELKAPKSANSVDDSDKNRIKFDEWLAEKLKLEKQQKLFKQKDKIHKKENK